MCLLLMGDGASRNYREPDELLTAKQPRRKAGNPTS